MAVPEYVPEYGFPEYGSILTGCDDTRSCADHHRLEKVEGGLSEGGD